MPTLLLSKLAETEEQQQEVVAAIPSIYPLNTAFTAQCKTTTTY
jgi:hypothetical protein